MRVCVSIVTKRFFFSVKQKCFKGGFPELNRKASGKWTTVNNNYIIYATNVAMLSIGHSAYIIFVMPTLKKYQI